MNDKIKFFITLLLFAGAWYIMHVTSSVHPVPIKKSLSLFPQQIDNYRLTNSFQSSAGVVKLLGVDDYIDYMYAESSGNPNPINLYVGYYTSVGVEGGYHSPKNCLPGSGWGIDSVKEIQLPVGIEGKKSSTVTEMVIREGDQYQIVLYWYQNRGRVIASEYWEKIYLILDALFKGRRDGTFVRIMDTVHDKDIQGAEKRLMKFAETVMVRLQDYLPGSHL